MTLIERLQQADGPSRELDAEIDWTIKRLSGRHAAPHYYGDTEGFWRDRNDLLHEAPRYTASLDAAMMLVDVSRYDYEIRKTYAHIFNRVGKREDYEGRAATPALALCIAALSAREASNG